MDYGSRRSRSADERESRADTRYAGRDSREGSYRAHESHSSRREEPTESRGSSSRDYPTRTSSGSEFRSRDEGRSGGSREREAHPSSSSSTQGRGRDDSEGHLRTSSKDSGRGRESSSSRPYDSHFLTNDDVRSRDRTEDGGERRREGGNFSLEERGAPSFRSSASSSRDEYGPLASDRDRYAPPSRYSDIPYRDDRRPRDLPPDSRPRADDSPHSSAHGGGMRDIPPGHRRREGDPAFDIRPSERTSYPPPPRRDERESAWVAVPRGDERRPLDYRPIDDGRRPFDDRRGSEDRRMEDRRSLEDRRPDWRESERGWRGREDDGGRRGMDSMEHFNPEMDGWGSSYDRRERPRSPGWDERRGSESDHYRRADEWDPAFSRERSGGDGRDWWRGEWRDSRMDDRPYPPAPHHDDWGRGQERRPSYEFDPRMDSGRGPEDSLRRPDRGDYGGGPDERERVHLEYSDWNAQPPAMERGGAADLALGSAKGEIGREGSGPNPNDSVRDLVDGIAGPLEISKDVKNPDLPPDAYNREPPTSQQWQAPAANSGRDVSKDTFSFTLAKKYIPLGCFNCGSWSHMSRECRKPCRKCGKADHTSSICPVNADRKQLPPLPTDHFFEFISYTGPWVRLCNKYPDMKNPKVNLLCAKHPDEAGVAVESSVTNREFTVLEGYGREEFCIKGLALPRATLILLLGPSAVAFCKRLRSTPEEIEAVLKKKSAPITELSSLRASVTAAATPRIKSETATTSRSQQLIESTGLGRNLSIPEECMKLVHEAVATNVQRILSKKIVTPVLASMINNRNAVLQAFDGDMNFVTTDKISGGIMEKLLAGRIDALPAQPSSKMKRTTPVPIAAATKVQTKSKKVVSSCDVTPVAPAIVLKSPPGGAAHCDSENESVPSFGSANAQQETPSVCVRHDSESESDDETQTTKSTSMKVPMTKLEEAAMKSKKFASQPAPVPKKEIPLVSVKKELAVASAKKETAVSSVKKEQSKSKNDISGSKKESVSVKKDSIGSKKDSNSAKKEVLAPKKDAAGVPKEISGKKDVTQKKETPGISAKKETPGLKKEVSAVPKKDSTPQPKAATKKGSTPQPAKKDTPVVKKDSKDAKVAAKKSRGRPPTKSVSGGGTAGSSTPAPKKKVPEVKFDWSTVRLTERQQLALLTQDGTFPAVKKKCKVMDSSSASSSGSSESESEVESDSSEGLKSTKRHSSSNESGEDSDGSESESDDSGSESESSIEVSKRKRKQDSNSAKRAKKVCSVAAVSSTPETQGATDSQALPRSTSPVPVREAPSQKVNKTPVRMSSSKKARTQSTPSSITEIVAKAEVDTETCARCIPYRQISHEEKSSYLQLHHSVSYDEQQAARDVRATHRRALVVDTQSDLFKFNHLKAREKDLHFAKSGVHGWGLFAKGRIEKNEMLIEYIGEVISNQVSEMREKEYERKGIGSSYLFRIDETLVIDATEKGNFARYINHSCNPNCFPRIIPVLGQKKVVLYSRQVILPGEELFYNYNFPLDDEDKVECHCGAPNCRGFMN